MRIYLGKLVSNIIKCSIILIIVFSSSYIHATDYNITSSTTSALSLQNNDTVTVTSDGSINRTGTRAIDGGWRSYAGGSTTITNAGTIQSTGNTTIYMYDATDLSINNSGTIQTTNGAYGAIYALSQNGTTTITNSGTIHSDDWSGIDVGTGSADVTINNSGTISADDYQAVRANSVTTDGFTLVNSGTITAASTGVYLYQSEGATITNSGTIRVTNGHDAVWVAYTDDITVTNSGTLRSDTGYAMSSIGYAGGENLTLTNTGTIQGNSYDLHTSSNTGIGTLSNDQGGNDALKLYGYLPVLYKIIVNSTDDFGKLAVTGQNGDMTFGIHTSSALAATTYSGVITGVSSGNITSGTTGTVSASNGVFTWQLNNSSGNDWDLVVSADSTDPTLSSSTPADNATGVAVNANIVLTFSEAVDAESGNITIKKTSDNSTIETISVTGSKVSGSGGTQITVNPGTNWDQKTEHYVLIDASAFDDASGNSYAGISSTTALSFTTVDSTNPTLSSASPADNATSVATNNNIVLTFDEAVDAESGNITIKRTSDDSTIETIDVTGSKVSGSGGTQITVNPGTDWAEQTEHYVLIDASAFDDASGNSYAGISSTTALSFTTGDETNPSLSSSSPADDGTDILIDANIVLTFSEAVDAESGNITIKKKKDDSTAQTIDVTGSNVSGSGGTEITVNPSKDLLNGTEYYVLIDASAFDDSAGNSYAGISSTTALSFTTKKGKIFSNTVKTLTKNQTAASVQTMAQSLTRVNSRMNYIRPMSNNTYRQNIKLAMNFDDPFANQLFDSLSRKFLKPKKETKDWAVWTEGNIAFGRIGHHDGNLGQDIHSDGVTIGIDKKTTENKTVGFAINKSWQETEVGSNEANMDAAAISMLTYGSYKIKEKTYIETAIGLGEMDIDLDREVTGGRNKGVRKGNQLFGSFTYLLEPDIEDEEKNLNYYTRVDLGYTILGQYTETGDSTAVHYNKQQVKSASLSAGFNLSKIIEIENGILTPLLKFEIGKDKTINSLSEAYYVTDSSTIYANAIGDQSSGHAVLSLGLGAQLENDFTINVTYDHYRSSNETFMNSFTINLRKSF